MILTFDPKDHVYRADGRVVHSVSQVGSGFRFNDEPVFIDTRWFKESGRKRGSDVHSAIEMINNGLLSVSDFSGADNEPYIQAYGTFLNDTGFKPILTEAMGYHPLYDYCGTIDTVGIKNDKLVLLDLKSGGKSKWYGVQLAAYALLLHDSPTLFRLTEKETENGILCEEYENPVYRKPLDRRILYIRNNGKYSFDEGFKDKQREYRFSDQYWTNAWIAAITLKQWAA